MMHSNIPVALLCLVISLAWSSQAQDTPQDFLNAHNTARADVGVRPLVWKDNIARYAGRFVYKEDCSLIHSEGPLGENIAWSRADLSAAEAVKSWFDEKPNYDHNTGTCSEGKVCKHYTQLVWRDSIYVGCAKVSCDNNKGTIVICGYEPPGNLFGEKPY